MKAILLVSISIILILIIVFVIIATKNKALSKAKADAKAKEIKEIKEKLRIEFQQIGQHPCDPSQVCKPCKSPDFENCVIDKMFSKFSWDEIKKMINYIGDDIPPEFKEALTKIIQECTIENCSQS